MTVVTDQQPNKTTYIIIRAYRQLREEEKFNVDLPAYFIRFLGTSEWYLAKGPTSKYYHDTNYNDIEERFKRADPVDNAIRWYDDLDHSCQGTDPAAAQVLPALPASDSALFRAPDILSKCEITLSISNTHVLKLFSFDRTFEIM